MRQMSAYRLWEQFDIDASTWQILAWKKKFGLKNWGEKKVLVKKIKKNKIEKILGWKKKLGKKFWRGKILSPYFDKILEAKI